MLRKLEIPTCSSSLIEQLLQRRLGHFRFVVAGCVERGGEGVRETESVCGVERYTEFLQ